METDGEKMVLGDIMKKATKRSVNLVKYIDEIKKTECHNTISEDITDSEMCQVCLFLREILDRFDRTEMKKLITSLIGGLLSTDTSAFEEHALPILVKDELSKNPTLDMEYFTTHSLFNIFNSSLSALITDIVLENTNDVFVSLGILDKVKNNIHDTVNTLMELAMLNAIQYKTDTNYKGIETA